MAHGIARYMGAFTEQVFGVAQKVDDVLIEPGIIVIGVLIGIATSMFAAWIPARNAAGVDPVQALQKGKYQVLTAGENRARLYGALASGVVAALCLIFGKSDAIFYTGYLLAILTALLLTPALALALARMLRPVLAFVRPVEGALAADSLIQAPRRTSATVSALMLSLAMVIGFAGITRTIYASVIEWLDTALNPDLFLSATDDLANRAFTFPPSVASEVQQVPGVEQTQMVRSARTLFRGTPVTVVALEVGKFEKKVRRRMIAGNQQDMYRRTAAGQGIMISDSFAGLRGVSLGETIELPTPRGLLRLPIAGITRDFSDDEGTILLDRSVFRQWWNDDKANIIRVYLKPGADQAAVKRAIADRFAGRQRLFVLTNADVRKYILRLTDEWFRMTYNQIAVAILVAMLGIVNTLTVSITDRRRELGVLQAVGGLRRQIRHTVWMEALAIAIVGLVLGWALGAINLYYTLGVTERDFAGMRLDYIYPVAIALALLPLIAGVAWAAALAPAESALRGSLVEALEYE